MMNGKMSTLSKLSKAFIDKTANSKQMLRTATQATIMEMMEGRRMFATTLQAGDIMITGIDTNNNDEVAFVPLVNLDGGTQIYFTDNGWQSAGSFRTGEGWVVYTAPGSAGTVGITAGTKIRFNPGVATSSLVLGAGSTSTSALTGTTTSFPSLSSSGDQILAFQPTGSNTTSPRFIYAITTNAATFDSDATNSNNSALPTGLTVGTNAIAVGVSADADYITTNGTTGTPAALRALVADNTKWTKNTTSTRLTLNSSNYTVNTLGTVTIAGTTATQNEGNSGTTPFTFTVTRNISTSAETVSYAVTGSGTNPADATDFGGTLPSGTVSFAIGETSKIVTVNVTGDTTPESTETFAVTLSSPSSGMVLGTPTSATGTITNDDASTFLAIAATDASKSEGNTGTTNYTFTVTRSGVITGTTSFDWAVTGNGTNPADATDFGGTFPGATGITFAAGETTKTITVSVSGDTTVETDEGFVVTLSNPTALSAISTSTATGTILNDDRQVDIQSAGISQLEGNSGTTAYAYTVTRTGDLSVATTVNWSVAGSSTYAADATDFGGTLPTGSITFAAGASTQTITVNVTGDTTAEENEQFTLTLNSSDNAAIGNASTTGTINSDDFALNAGDVAITGINTTNPDQFSFIPLVDLAAGQVIVFTDNAWTGTALATNEGTVTYTAPAGGLAKGTKIVIQSAGASSSIIFPITPPANPGTVTSTASFSLNSTGENLFAYLPTGTTPHFLFGVFTGTAFLTSGTTSASTTYLPSELTAGTTALAPLASTGTVANAQYDETTYPTSFSTNALALASIADKSHWVVSGSALGLNTGSYTLGSTVSLTGTTATQSEGNSGTTPFTFTVSRTNSTGSASVNWAVTGSGTNPADATDFGGTLPSGTVNFANGETSKVITINVTGDTTVEQDETFTVTLSNPTSLTLGTSTATGTIVNDDATTTLAITATDASKAEGNTGTTNYTFTVTRSGVTTGSTTFDWAVTGYGTNPADATDFGGTFPGTTGITFAAGETSKTITVAVSGDTTVETDEGFVVTLSNPSTLSAITTATAIGTIINDDRQVSLQAAGITHNEGNSGSTTYTYTVTRTGDLTAATTVNWSVAGSGTNAADATDFGSALPSGSITFAAGASTQTIVVNVAGDTTIEQDEQFTLTLDSSSNASIGTASATGTILNDDYVLNAGDVVITGINTTNPDQFSFVPLVDVPAGQQIVFTDNAWSGTALATSEGNIIYTAPAGGLAKGTKIIVTSNSGVTLSPNVGTPSTTGSFNLSTSGDNIFAYVGSSTNPHFLFSVFTGSAYLTGGATTTANTTYLPSDLTAGTNAVAPLASTGTISNAQYNGSVTFATAANALSAVANVANWITSSTALTLTTTDFTLGQTNPTLSLTSATKIYDGSAFSASSSATGASGTDTSGFTYSYFDSGNSPISAPTNVGSYFVTATYAGNATYLPASQQFSFTITAKSLTASITASNKPYDGNTSAAVTYSLAGIVGSDVVLANGTATFSDSAVGTAKTVTAIGISLTGADAGNYSVNTSATTTADITAVNPTWLSPTGSFSWSGGTLTVYGNATIIADPALDAPSIVLASSSAHLTINAAGAAVNINTITDTDGLITVTSGTPVIAGAVSITGTGTIDLTSQSAIFRSMTESDVHAMITSGFNGGDWLGTGITSSNAANDNDGVTAVGYANNNDLGASDYNGVPLGATDTIVKYTYYGDADLSGTVTLEDFTQFLVGYQQGGTPNWINGDFDYSGTVTLEDFSLFLAGYQGPNTPLAPAATESVAHSLFSDTPITIVP